jgi:dihydrofolate synthase/folylpolyglutamate synthase
MRYRARGNSRPSNLKIPEKAPSNLPSSAPSSASPRLSAAVRRLDARQNWERRDRSQGWRVDLDPVRDLARRLGGPHLGRVTVHVTGTKGKGSVAALTAAGLQAAGLAVGVTTSPHVERLNERVLVPGPGGGAPTPIADDDFALALERVLDAHDAALSEGGESAERTSWFDLVSLAAFTAFRAAGLDAQVVEVGLGGRLDSTNIVAPDVCVLTNVDLEHTAILGATRAAIAGEKAGILKPGAAVVSGMPAGDEAGDVVLARARELGAFVRLAAPRPADSIFERNLRLARAALDLLGARGIVGKGGVAVSGGLLTEALARAAALPGRMEQRSVRGVPVLFDGAHVPSSLALVVTEALADPRLRGTPVTVVAVHHEKDTARLLAPLVRLGGRVLCTTLPTGVHQSAEEVAAVARAVGLQADSVPDPVAALEAALVSLRGPGWVLVTGSLYLVGALRSRTSASPDP